MSPPREGEARARPLLIGSEIYRGSTYGPKHPLAIPRVPATLDLIAALGWLDPARFQDSPRATPEQLTRFHTPDYVAALMEAEREQRVSPEVRERHRIGADGNPVYREVFSRPATGAGGMLLAAELTRQGGVVHIPGAGTHHGRPDRASGFCYLNDCVLGILAWLEQGLTRVLYLDVDAHHGDGVQDAFAGDPRVVSFSIHEAGRWPATGALEDDGGGNAVNLPMPPGFHDSEFRHVLRHALRPVLDAFRPQAILLQCGADALEEDPLARLALSNNAHRALAAALPREAPRLIVTGGGGYNPWSVARCWAGVWGALNGHKLPARLPPAAEAVLRGLSWSRSQGRNPPDSWFTTLADPPREGEVRETVREGTAVVAARWGRRGV